MPAPLPFVVSALVLAAALCAHGGQYRGPGSPTGPGPRTPLGGGPTTGGPSGPTAPSPGTPTTGAMPSIAEEVGWQVWWEFNKDEFLQQGSATGIAPTTGSDDFYLGWRRAEAAVDTLRPTDADLSQRVVPALARLLQRERNRDVQSACLIALGKVGRDGDGVVIEPLLAERIARDDQEVREAAVLALGIAGRPAALPLLAALLRNDAEGKRLARREDVGDRTRAFAAYALGLLAARSDDAAHKRQAHDLLWAVLQDQELRSRDLRAAAVNGLGLLVDPQQPAHKRLAWQIVEQLLEWYQRDLGRGDEAIQAQAPVAIGRLLGRGSSAIHQRCKEHFAGVLGATVRRSNPVLQSAALALGMLTLPAEVHPADAAFAGALQQHYERGHDRLARYLCVIAVGRIGGAQNRAWLFDAYRRGHRATERPWLALALGLQAAAAAAATGEVDATCARVLLDDLPGAQRPEGQAACAVAIGLTRFQPAVPVVQRLLRENEQDETLAGYLCVALALLGDASVAPALSEIMQRSLRRPFLLLQAAVGLGRLGDREATVRLLELLQKSESVAVLAAVANAIGQIGDRRAIDPLVALTQDEELTRLARAFVAAALGGVGDLRPLPWNVPLSKDSNYGAPVDTLTNGATGVLDIL